MLRGQQVLPPERSAQPPLSPLPPPSWLPSGRHHHLNAPHPFPLHPPAAADARYHPPGAKHKDPQFRHEDVHCLALDRLKVRRGTKGREEGEGEERDKGARGSKGHKEVEKETKKKRTGMIPAVPTRVIARLG